jgi:hypothetical protein
MYKFKASMSGAFTSQKKMLSVSVGSNIYAMNTLDMASRSMIECIDLVDLVEDQTKTPCSNTATPNKQLHPV